MVGSAHHLSLPVFSTEGDMSGRYVWYVMYSIVLGKQIARMSTKGKIKLEDDSESVLQNTVVDMPNTLIIFGPRLAVRVLG